LEPLLGVASKLGSKDFTFALVVHAPPGVGHQEFPVGGAQRYMMVSREAIILNYSANVAYAVGEKFGVGASLQWIHVPKLRYSLVIDGNTFPQTANPVSAALDMLATTEGSDPFTFNAVLGGWVRPVPELELALAAQIVPASIRTNSTLTIDPQSPEIEEEVELRRGGEAANDVELTLPLPQTVRLGARYRNLVAGRERFDVELDLVYERWSRVDRFVVDTNGLTAHLLAQRLDIGTINVDKYWNDTFSVALGGDYNIDEQWTVRGGFFFETAVADRAYAHVDFVGGNQLGGALGASFRVGALELGLAYEYRHQPTVSVRESEAAVYQEVPGSQCVEPYTDPDKCHPAFIGRPAPPVNAGTYSAHSHGATLDVLYRL
jgi:long-chain fatty acid transport protein